MAGISFIGNDIAGVSWGTIDVLGISLGSVEVWAYRSPLPLRVTVGGSMRVTVDGRRRITIPVPPVIVRQPVVDEFYVAGTGYVWEAWDFGYPSLTLWWNSTQVANDVDLSVTGSETEWTDPAAGWTYYRGAYHADDDAYGVYREITPVGSWFNMMSGSEGSVDRGFVLPTRGSIDREPLDGQQLTECSIWYNGSNGILKFAGDDCTGLLTGKVIYIDGTGGYALTSISYAGGITQASFAAAPARAIVGGQSYLIEIRD